MYSNKLNDLHSLPWELAKPHLENALQGYDPAAEIEAGIAFPFFVNGAFALVRTELHEMVVIAFEGVHKLKEACPVLLALAKCIQAKSIRLHTRRPGEKRYLNKLGYAFELIEMRNQDEHVLRMVLDGR